MTSEMIVHLVDDDSSIRGSLTFLMESSGLTPRAYSSAEELLAVAGDLEPGCIVTDVRMPKMSGLELIRELKARGIDLPVVVMTGHGDIPMAVEAMKEGVVDFLEKPFEEEALLAAVKRALEREEHVDGQRAEIQRIREALDRLSSREREVLAGVIDGKLNKIIAYDLGISPRTVEIYRANVMTKTGAGNLSELVRMALMAGFR